MLSFPQPIIGVGWVLKFIFASFVSPLDFLSSWLDASPPLTLPDHHQSIKISSFVLHFAITNKKSMSEIEDLAHGVFLFFVVLKLANGTLIKQFQNEMVNSIPSFEMRLQAQLQSTYGHQPSCRRLQSKWSLNLFTVGNELKVLSDSSQFSQ